LIAPLASSKNRQTNKSSGALWPVRMADAATALSRIPHSFIALVARFSIAAIFWKSGQTKIQGFELDIIDWRLIVEFPALSDSAVELFRDEYRLPLLPPETAATMAAVAEHVLAASILIGLATRLSAAGLLAMTLVIQIFVYPGAYPTHGVWAAVLLLLMARGPGTISLDAWIAARAIEKMR
jgi:putative oxidoreductase